MRIFSLASIMVVLCLFLSPAFSSAQDQPTSTGQPDQLKARLQVLQAEREFLELQLSRVLNEATGTQEQLKQCQQAHVAKSPSETPDPTVQSPAE